eukprot:gene10615-10773_t
MAVDRALSKRVSFINERLQVLDRLSDESVQLLDVLGHSLYEVSNLTAPIHMRATALTSAQRNIAAAKDAVDQLIEHVGTSRRVQGVLEAGPASNLECFLDALQQLEASNDYLQKHNRLAAVKSAVQHTQVVFNRALEQYGGNAGLVRELIPAADLPKLQRMVRLMMDADYAPAQGTYVATRDKLVRQVLQELGLDLQPAGAVAGMLTEQLDRVVHTWSSQLKAVTVLLVSEQHLASLLWPPPLDQEVFARLAAPYLRALATVGADITEARKTPDRVFALLDMHRQLSTCLPVLTAMLSGDSRVADRLLADLTCLLQECSATSLMLFREYEDSVSRDGNKMLPQDGTIHPLTAQVLSYLKRLLGYDNSAEVIYGAPTEDGGPSGTSPVANNGTSAATARAGLATGIARLLMQLMDNLEVKSRGYKNEALAALFMMNNVHYVQWSVEGSQMALQLLGVPWLERHKDAVEDWGAKYHDAIWMPLVHMLKIEPTNDITRVKSMLKETFTSFNAAIERIYTNQSGWTIPDHMLRGAVKRVIKDDLLQPYQEFLKQYADVQFTSTPAKYIKFAVSDVASIIDDDLFETKAVSLNKLSLKKEKLDAIM